MSEPRQKLTRRQWAAYWAFVVAAVLVLSTLAAAVEVGNRPLAAAVLAVAGVLAFAWFVIVVAHIARNP